MKTLALFLGKVGILIGKITGRGSALPGKLALTVDKKLTSKMRLSRKIVMVTGTNGKTSTTHFISKIFEKNGTRVCWNREGANMPQGIMTVILKDCNMSGKIKSKACVFETDEAFLSKMTELIRPEYVVITNIFDDQADRFGSKENVAELIKSGIPDKTKVIANGMDPYVVNLLRDFDQSRIIYFGVDKIENEENSKQIKSPVSDNFLNYEFRHYDHIGKFSDGDFVMPELKYMATNVDLKNKKFKINGEDFHSEYAGASYFIFNMVAAYAYHKEMGTSTDKISQVYEEHKVGEGRLEEVTFNGYKTIFNLVKNPVGLNISLKYISDNEKNDYNLYLGINNKPADGEDIGWLKTIDFEYLKEEKLKEIILGGERAKEVAEIIEEKGIKKDKITIADNLDEKIQILKNSPLKTYFLANYTAMAQIKPYLK